MSRVIPKWKPQYLRVWSRHPSHDGIRNAIKMPPNKVGVIRLGSNTSMRTFSPDIEINTVESIERTMNKFEMKKAFAQANVRSPEFFVLNNENAGIWNEAGYRFISFEDLSKHLLANKLFPVLAKRTYRSRGAGMQKLDNVDEYLEFINENIINNRYHQRNPYYLEVFKNYIKEYRIHVSELGGYFYSCRKMLKSEYTGTENNWYRNDSNSIWIMEENELFDKPTTWKEIIKDCQNARVALGLSIGAVDVKVNKEGNWAILEMNSAPSFGDVTETAYLYELTKIVRTK